MMTVNTSEGMKTVRKLIALEFRYAGAYDINAGRRKVTYRTISAISG
jgi:hypothetical protein